MSDTLRRATLVVMKVWAVYNPSMYLFGSLGVLLMVVVGTHELLSGATSWAISALFLCLPVILYEPVGKLHQLQPTECRQGGRRGNASSKS